MLHLLRSCTGLPVHDAFGTRKTGDTELALDLSAASEFGNLPNNLTFMVSLPERQDATIVDGLHVYAIRALHALVQPRR